MELNSWTLFEVHRLARAERLARSRRLVLAAQRRAGAARRLARWSGALLLRCGAALMRFGEPAAVSPAPLQRY